MIRQLNPNDNFHRLTYYETCGNLIWEHADLIIKSAYTVIMSERIQTKFQYERVSYVNRFVSNSALRIKRDYTLVLNACVCPAGRYRNSRAANAFARRCTR